MDPNKLWGDTKPEDWKKESWAIIANNNGQGCILAYGGGVSLKYEIEEVGCSCLEDLSLDDAPNGLSVWEGHYSYRSCSFPHNDEDTRETCGRFRPLNNREWKIVRKISLGEQNE